MINCPFFGRKRPSFRGLTLVLNGKIETKARNTEPQFLETKKQHRMACYRCILQHRQGWENSEVSLVGKGGAVQGDVLTVEQTNNL